MSLASEHFFLHAWCEVAVMGLNHTNRRTHLPRKCMNIHPFLHQRKRSLGVTQAVEHAIGHSRGGLTTKVVALIDALENLANFVFLPG